MVCKIEECVKERREEESIDVADFLGFVAWKRPIRTHTLEVRDYVALQNPLQKGCINMEKIAGLNLPEKGDFTTAKGTIGPISGNVFVKMSRGLPQRPMLVEGDYVAKGNGSVYDSVAKYREVLKTRCSQRKPD